MNILHQQKVEREWSQFWLKLEDVQNKEINWVEISSYHPIVFVIELLSPKKKCFKAVMDKIRRLAENIFFDSNFVGII